MRCHPPSDVCPADRRRLIAAGLDALQEVQKIGLQVRLIVRRRHAVDAGRTILAGQPVGLLHPFQVDDVVQRGQRHPSFRPRQFGYPLSFRGQVCGAQSPLPCFPSTVLSTWRLPSLGRVPVSPVPRRHRYYEGATTSRSRIPGHLLVSLPGPTCASVVRARRRAPVRVEDAVEARTLGQPAVPCSGLLSRGRERDLPGSLAIHPMPLPCSKTPAEPTILATDGPVDAAPASTTRRPQRSHDFGADTWLQHPLSTLHERCCHRPCKTRFRLAGSPLPGGGRTLWIAMKGFRSHSFSFPGLFLALLDFARGKLRPEWRGLLSTKSSESLRQGLSASRYALRSSVNGNGHTR